VFILLLDMNQSRITDAFASKLALAVDCHSYSWDLDKSLSLFTRILATISWDQIRVMSVGASDAGILASDFCDVPTDTTLLVDNWQPMPAAKQRKTDTLTCC